ncbi:acyl dehydratase [Pseudomonas duriflava]|uniref:Acyl dehydratase n=1 Tax=Pseudomonas duriflava TaxID=459528 RepID=A0A562QG38_9PSED|nr:MaoC family dehydratase [Pseudomonas duriflava]TWI55663.1 acyl dehydratase [Pseudomonas duriflava]
MSITENKPYETLEVGQKAIVSRIVEERDILLFAEVSGDRNPVHLDEAYAAKTAFKGRIAHGMLTGALISAAIACELPGPGSIYLGQSLTFSKPVKLGDTLRIEIEVLEKLPKNRVRLATRIFNQHDESVVEGEAEVLAPRKPLSIELSTLPPVTIG